MPLAAADLNVSKVSSQPFRQLGDSEQLQLQLQLQLQVEFEGSGRSTLVGPVPWYLRLDFSYSTSPSGGTLALLLEYRKYANSPSIIMPQV